MVTHYTNELPTDLYRADGVRELDRLAIDVINGGPALREWVDDAAALPDDLDAMASRDERDWREAIDRLLLYKS